MRLCVSGLDLAGLLMQLSSAAVGLGLFAMNPLEVGIGRSLRFQLSLPLVLQRPGGSLARTLCALQRRVMRAPVSHGRSIAHTG